MTFLEKRVAIDADLAMAVRIYEAAGERPTDKTPVICIPGLTRNSADFSDIAPLIAETGRTVYAVDLRGRGRSDRDPDYRRYHPAQYRDDIITVVNNLAGGPCIFFGTSLGALITMLTNAQAPDLVRAAILNDAGPELAADGLARIATYVGAEVEPAESLGEAAARAKGVNDEAHPDFSEEDWREFARRTYRRRDDGRYELDYDPGIARAFLEGGAPLDLPAAFDTLRDTPTLMLRGVLSDIVTADMVAAWRKDYPHLDYAEAENVGHAPTLREPEIVSAVTSFLERID